MFSCYILFEDPVKIAKYTQLLERINPQISVHKILDKKQLLNKLQPNEKTILITHPEGHEDTIDLSEQLSLKIIICEGAKESVESNTYFISSKLVITRLGTILNDFIEEHTKEIIYVPVGITKIRQSISYPCPFFMKLGKEKYIKIGNGGAQIDLSVFQKLLLKKVEFLYIKKEDFKVLVDFLQSLNKNKNKTMDAAEAETKAVETIHDYILDLGFDPKVITLTKTMHKNIEDKFTSKFMKSLLGRFAALEGTFIYNHSYLTSVLALTIGQKYTWMNYDNKEKLYLGAILHDLGFKNKENATFENLKKSSLDTLDPDAKDDVLNHTIRFSQKLAQVNDIHQDVIKMVRDHHAVYNEDSYPNKVHGPEINLIFALFILSHDFSLKLYKISFNPKKIPLILNETVEAFDKGNYRKILPEFKEAVEQLFLE